ncbi:MAG: hypothetical protein WD226_09280 [Planctomycetota bacterium]
MNPQGKGEPVVTRPEQSAESLVSLHRGHGASPDDSDASMPASPRQTLRARGQAGSDELRVQAASSDGPGLTTEIVLASGGVEVQLCDARRAPWPTPVDFQLERSTDSESAKPYRLRWEGSGVPIVIESGWWQVRSLDPRYDVTSIVVDGAVVLDAADGSSANPSFEVPTSARVVQILIRSGTTLLLTHRLTKEPVETHARVLRRFDTQRGTTLESVVFEGESNARGELVVPVIADDVVLQLDARGFERTRVEPFPGRNEAECRVFLSPCVESTLSIQDRSGAPFDGLAIVHAIQGAERRLTWFGRVPADGEVRGLFLSSGFDLEVEDSSRERLAYVHADEVVLGGRTEIIVPRMGASLRVRDVPAKPPPIVARDRDAWDRLFSPVDGSELVVDSLPPGTYYVGPASMLTASPAAPSAFGGEARFPPGVIRVDLADGDERSLTWREEWNAPGEPFTGTVEIVGGPARTATLVPVYDLHADVLTAEGARTQFHVLCCGSYELPSSWGSPEGLLVCARSVSGRLDLLDVIRPGQSTSIECASLSVELEDAAAPVHWRLQVRHDDLTQPANVQVVEFRGRLTRHLVIDGLPPSRGTLTAWRPGWKQTVDVTLEAGTESRVVLRR